MKKEAMNLKENRAGQAEGFGGRKRKGEMLSLYYNLKKLKRESGHSSMDSR